MPPVFWSKEARFSAEGSGEYGAEETPEGLNQALGTMEERAVQRQVKSPGQEEDRELIVIQFCKTV